jgi:hypothetical protein
VHKMKKYILPVGTAILAVLLPIIVLNLSYFKNFSKLDMFGYSLSVVLTIASLFSLLHNHLEDKIKNISNAYNQLGQSVDHLVKASGSRENYIYAISREDLYKRMKEFAQNSEKRMNLMYMGSRPPTEYGSFSSKAEYIQSLAEKISSNDIHIRRIILYSSANKSWIKKLSKTYIDKNVSLYIINEGGVNIHSAQVSVQLFDNSKVILMNFDSSDISMGARDIVIDSIELNRIFESYYERFITNGIAIPIIENGKVNTPNEKKYL